MKSAPAIAFDYRPSRWLAASVVAITLIGLVALALSGISTWARLALGGFACAYAALALQRLLYSPARRVAWHEAGHWRIGLDNVEQVADLEYAVVRGGWIVLTLRRADGARMPLVLAPDNCDADVRRRLRVRLQRA